MAFLSSDMAFWSHWGADMSIKISGGADPEVLSSEICKSCDFVQPSHGFARFLTLREVENGGIWGLFCDSGTTQHKEGFQYDI